MAYTGNSTLDNPSTVVVAVGSISITDIFDATPIQSFIMPTTVSAQSSQVYDKVKNTYNPDYQSSPFVGKLTLIKAGTNIDISSGMDTVSWYVELDKVTLPINDPSVSGMFSISGSSNEVVSLVKNLTDPQITLKAYTNYIDSEKQTVTPVYATYIVKKQDLNKTALVVNDYTPNGFIFMNNNPSNITLNSEVFLDGTKDNTKKRSYSWFRQDTSITSTTDSRYDSRMGLGWAKVILSDTTAKPNSEFNSEVTSDAMLTVLQDDVINFETYVLITVPKEGDQSGNSHRSFFTVYTYDANTVINIDCPTGFVYKNGSGNKTIRARVYTSIGETDTDGTTYIYKWYSYEEDGTLNTNFGGNGVSYKTGKTITLGSGEFGDLTQLVVEIEMP